MAYFSLLGSVMMHRFYDWHEFVMTQIRPLYMSGIEADGMSATSTDVFTCIRCGNTLLQRDDSRKDCDHDSSVSATVPSPRKRQKPRLQPELLRFKEIRYCVRALMISQIPGISLKKAKSIVQKYPTLTQLMDVNIFELESLELAQYKPLGNRLATALKHTIQ